MGVLIRIIIIMVMTFFCGQFRLGLDRVSLIVRTIIVIIFIIITLGLPHVLGMSRGPLWAPLMCVECIVFQLGRRIFS